MTPTVDTAPDTWVGSIVLSLAGRDRKRLFVIVSLDEVNGYVYVADGKLRQIQHPKKKNCKHVRLLAGSDPALRMAIKEGTLTNRNLREALAPFQTSETAVEEGLFCQRTI